MFRASTPLQKFTFEFDVNQFIEKVLITYKQDEIIFEKTLEDCSVDGNSVYFTLTQAETNLLNPNLPVRIQLRVKTKNEKVLPSRIFLLSVNDVLNSEEL